MKDLKELKEKYALLGKEFEAVGKEFEELGKEIEKLESESKLPMSWEDISEDKKPKEYFSHQKENLPTKELAEAVMYRNMLITLVHIWNDGEQLNWSDEKKWKYCIVLYMDKYEKNQYMTSKQILAFKTEELRDKFFDNPIFQEYMEKAKLAM